MHIFAHIYGSTCSGFQSDICCTVLSWEITNHMDLWSGVKQRQQEQDLFKTKDHRKTSRLAKMAPDFPRSLQRRLSFLSCTVRPFCLILLVPSKLAPYPKLLGCVTVDLLPPPGRGCCLRSYKGAAAMVVLQGRLHP